MDRRLAVAVSFVTALSAPALAHAGCGSAFCTVNADWGTQGLWTEPGGRVDLRFEFIDLKQPKQGATKVGLGEVPEEIEEVQTINRNWVAAFDYNFDGHWGISATVPLVNRYHHHIVDPEAAPAPEQWAFTELGDVRVQGRYRFTLGTDSPISAGVALGLKLPTGSFNVTNSEDVAAERMLQPGTGTTDALVTVFLSRPLSPKDSMFVQLSFEAALDSRDAYRPGNRIYLNLGYNRWLTSRLGLQLQLNFAYKRPEEGDNAEPDLSGGKYIYFSPGLSYDLSHAWQVYAYLQLPLYQYVNGVQLTANWAALAGVSWRF
jgi:hypothetical protein